MMTTLRTLTLTLAAAATFYVLPAVALACPGGARNCDEQPEPAIELACPAFNPDCDVQPIDEILLACPCGASDCDEPIEPFPGGLRLACDASDPTCRATTPEPAVELG
jgi:hypothetical protein